jgi:hypothetical protein
MIMNNPKDADDLKVEECPICKGLEFMNEDPCNWCEGTGHVTETQMYQCLNPLAYEDWKYFKELKSIEKWKAKITGRQR